MSICAPLGTKSKTFIGAYCTDILPTISVNKKEVQDNYLHNMYLRGTYSNTTNYVIFKDSGLVILASFSII